MFVLLYFVPPFLAYRMGARGGWLVSIVAFSWIAFAIWLLARSPDKALMQRREDAELERTLLIVRAINPQMADRISIDRAIERTLAAAPRRAPKATPARARHPSLGVVLLAILLLVGLFNLVKVLATLEPHSAGLADAQSATAQRATAESAAESATVLDPHAAGRRATAPSAVAEARDPVTGATYRERELVKGMIRAGTGGPFGRELPPGDTVDSLADDVLAHLQALGK